SRWRAGLVTELVSRVRRGLAEGSGDDVQPPRVDVPDEVRGDPRRVDVRVRATGDGATVTVVSGDRVGLMADIAGALAVQRVSVRAARAWGQEDLAVSVWEVDDAHLDPAVLRQRFESVAERRVDPGERLRPPPAGSLEPSVQVRHDASQQATVLEVRVDDVPGVVYRVCSALAGLDLWVRSAHLATFGPQAADVFYVQEPGAGALSDERAASAAHAVRHALRPPG
ncbi:MAG: hypothetical protein HOQ22_14230, partial [Nocardioidaceae bacterium]|nr:hypothetical protein [Nocardioidaceae bacterium]